MTDRTELPRPVLLNPFSHYAFFFDIDGTLTDLRSRPEKVSISPDVFNIFEYLNKRGIPFALVSGRSVNDIDSLMCSRKLICAGIHGAQIRYGNGRYEQVEISGLDVACVWERLKLACGRFSGLRLENKLISFAIHFREAPELAGEAMWIAASLSELYPDSFAVQMGKNVCELRPNRVNKGLAVEKIMATPPFCGKTPVYIGDDITDEAAFRTVNEMDGCTVKVGNEETTAMYRLKNVKGVLNWMNELIFWDSEA